MAPIPNIAPTSPWNTKGSSGVTTMSKLEIQRWARSVLTSETHRLMMQKKLEDGTLEVPLVQMLYHYAFGKPVENVQLNVSVAEDLSQVPTEQILKRFEDRLAQLKEVEAIENAIPVEFKVCPQDDDANAA